MFDYLNGILSYKNFSENTSITVDVNGIGYLIFICSEDFNALPDLNSKILVYTILVHKEDSMTLYGFLKRESRDMFNILTSVSGVGPKMAMQILNYFNPAELSLIVSNENVKTLTSAKGVGSKLAQKIIIELKDKLTNFEHNISVDTSLSKNVNEKTLQEVQDVLNSFGYDSEEIKNAIKDSLKHVQEKDSAEDILKYALKYLSN